MVIIFALGQEDPLIIGWIPLFLLIALLTQFHT